MSIFNKKETLTQNMAFMAIMAGINVLLSLLIGFVPVLALFLIIILPLVSTIVEVFCKDRYYPIYALATIGLSFAVSFWNYEATIFYIIPAILIGFTFGFTLKKKVAPLWAILINAIVQTLLTIGSLELIKLVFQEDLYQKIPQLLHFDITPAYETFYVPMLFVISLIEIVLSYIVVSNEIKKFGYEYSNEIREKAYLGIITLVISLIGLGVSFLYETGGYICLFSVIYLMIFILIDMVLNKNILQLVLSGISILISLLLFLLLFQYMPDFKAGTFLLIAPAAISIIYLSHYLLLKRTNK